MKMPQLRKCAQWNEFSQLLNSLHKSNNRFLSWKTQFKGEVTRTKSDVKLLNVEGFKRKVHLTFSFDKDLSCEKNATLYFFHEESGALFRGTVLKSAPKAVSLSVQELPFLLEKREHSRLSFDNTHYQVKASFPRESRQHEKVVQMKLADIGIKGMGLMSSAIMAERVHKGDRVKLITIESIKLPEPIFGRVAHITPIRSGLDEKKSPAQLSKLVVIGVCFDVPSMLLAQIFDGLNA